MRNIQVNTSRLLLLLVTVFPIMVATLLIPTVSQAQPQSGTLKGTVKSPSGTPLSRVSVQAANSGKGTSTDDNGLYTLSLAAGNYEITYSSPGHTPQTVSVTITPGATIVQDIILAVQSATTTREIVQPIEISQISPILRPQIQAPCPYVSTYCSSSSSLPSPAQPNPSGTPACPNRHA
ncbi:carboxypeptidase-like regulatory domain-containing protein [Puia sp. P3]|uniref:carboxypeptidase-like regulatory domain-containing protein n=1 Tax=Puia sp. P3 TaxID=3423952 RepID=UPI003D66CFCF